MITELRITPTEIGNFTVVCSQLCGPEHTYMTAPVRVLSQSDYDAWVQQQLAPPPLQQQPRCPEWGHDLMKNLFSSGLIKGLIFGVSGAGIGMALLSA